MLQYFGGRNRWMLFNSGHQNLLQQLLSLYNWETRIKSGCSWKYKIFIKIFWSFMSNYINVAFLNILSLEFARRVRESKRHTIVFMSFEGSCDGRCEKQLMINIAGKGGKRSLVYFCMFLFIFFFRTSNFHNFKSIFEDK